MKNVATLFVIAAIFLSVAKASLADQYGPYQGPSASYSIIVDKLVGVPSTDSNGAVTYSYVDNLGVNDFKFKADNWLFFKIKVKNTSNTQIDNVVAKDTAPDFVTLFDNPGTFDSNTKVLTINVGSLAANEEKEYIVRGRVVSSGSLPADSGIVCVVNRVVASNDKVSDDDSSQLCIEKPVAGVSTTTVSVPTVTKIPSTGPEAGLAILSLSGAMGWAGMKLRKYTA